MTFYSVKSIVAYLTGIGGLVYSPFIAEKALNQNAWPIIPLYLFVCIELILIGGKSS